MASDKTKKLLHKRDFFGPAPKGRPWVDEEGPQETKVAEEKHRPRRNNPNTAFVKKTDA
jgi:hypothetical protein